ADFSATRARRGRPTEIAVEPTDPLLRDWVVICDGTRFTACLAGVELAGPDRRRVAQPHRRLSRRVTPPVRQPPCIAQRKALVVRAPAAPTRTRSLTGS